MNQIKAIALLGGLIASSALFNPNAYCVPINGEISIAGAYTPDNSDLSMATEVTFGSTLVFGSSGDFSSVGMFTPVTMAGSLAWDPVLSVSSNPLWSVGGFSFELLSLMVSNESANSITLNGAGVVKAAGFDNTPGTWIATLNGGSSTFSWSATSATVPDSGPAFLLLGGAVVAVGWLRRPPGSAASRRSL